MGNGRANPLVALRSEEVLMFRCVFLCCLLCLVCLLAIAVGTAVALELTPAKEIFGFDEDVVVAAYNDTQGNITFGSSAPFVARNLNTGFVLPLVGLTIVIDLMPGESMEFGFMGGFAEPGPYELEFHYWEGNFERASQSVFLDIANEFTAETAEPSVSQVKSAYSRR
jgi:hypothetical protein